MSTQRPITVSQRTTLYADATSVVLSDFASDLSLDTVARRVASSRRQLQRVYAEIGNTTFREHLTQVRMQKAAELLAAGGLTVREVAGRVGYRQPAQFAKAFRRHQGVTPSSYPSHHARLSLAAEPDGGRLQRASGAMPSADPAFDGAEPSAPLIGQQAA